MHSFEIWLATTVVFFCSGNVGFTLLEYRLGEKELVWRFLITVSTVVLNERRLADIILDKLILDTVLVSRLSSATLRNPR